MCVHALQGATDHGADDDDDVASVNSDRSALSFSSEISINPYTKYNNPVQVSLVCMCVCMHACSREGVQTLVSMEEH